MKPSSPPRIAAVLRWFFAGVAAVLLFSPPSGRAAPEERWLLIFDTSAAMKKRLPAVEVAVKNFFTTGGSGQLQAGDSVGVWTFDQQLRTGQFPLIHWPPVNVGETASNLVAFVRQQHFTGKTSFAALQPLLGEVINHSERLTVIVYCDGQDVISWTPYAEGINRTFGQNQDERKSARQPFALLLRTQQGKFTGCAVNFPPGTFSIPAFPPLPAPPVVKTELLTGSALVASKPTPLVVPSLVIVGTNVGTNLADMLLSTNAGSPKTFAPTNHSESTNNAKPKSHHSSVAGNSNPPLMKVASPTNLNAVSATASDVASQRGLLVLGGGLLAAFLMLILLGVRSRRREHGSLITASMEQNRKPPEQN